MRVSVEFDECSSFLSSHHLSALVVQVPAWSDSEELSPLLELRRQFPFVPMLGMYTAQGSDLGAVARLGSVGVQHVVTTDPPARPELIRALLSSGYKESVVNRVWRMASLMVADPVATVLRPAVRLAHSPVTLPQLAAEKRMHERSLRKYCENHGLPSPQWIIGWARTLVIAYYLEEPGRSVKSIAELLGFPSPALLANHLRRYTGRTASDLRRDAPLSTVARLLESSLMPFSLVHRTTGRDPEARSTSSWYSGDRH